MRRSAILPLAVFAISNSLFPAVPDPGSIPLREQFLEIARLQELTRDKVFYLSDDHDKELIRQANDANRVLLKEPTDMVFSAVTKSLNEGSKSEVAGALYAYSYLISMKHLVPNPDYKPLLLQKLAADDFSSNNYTAALRSGLLLFPSRETVLAFMDAAKWAPNAQVKEDFVGVAAALLDIDLHYATSDSTPDRKRRAIAEFESWYEQNKDSIRFDKNGEAHFHGGPGEWKPPKLTSEDKARIKADPVCVLRLFEAIQTPEDPESAQIQDLNTRCGRALLGEKGTAALSKALEEAKDHTAPNLEQQFSMSSATAYYPTVSAALTAVAYVASSDPIDPKAKELARRILDDFGEDLEAILKEEPASVRKKVLELAE